MDALLTLMARLRDPVGGCPWDLEQTWSTIAPYTVEEAYEVADAIERDHPDDIRDELGDLLFQVVFQAQIASEAGAFTFDDVARAITDKMIRRHPHVFGDAEQRTSAAQTVAWEHQKAAERAAKGQDRTRLLDDIPPGLPAMTRAVKLTRRAARVGFDWSRISDVTDKLREELAELEVEIEADDRAKAEDELGDLLFVCANLARKLDIDPEHALRGANAKFTRRFQHIEDRLTAAGTPLEDAGLEAMEVLWDEAKRIERGQAVPAGTTPTTTTRG
jgi:MazG family protein